VINFGTEDRNLTRVTLAVDGRTVAEKRVDVTKGSVQGTEFDLPGLSAGMHNVALEVDDPRLTRDNRFAMTLQARVKIPVLSVENPAGGKGGRAPSFFLADALNISALSPYRLTAVAPEQFESMGAVPAGLLIWNNVSGGSNPLQRKLQDFVKGGGGLIIVLADSSLAFDFGRSFASWLPFKVDPAVAGSGRSSGLQPAEDYSLLTDLRLDHPIFRAFSEPHAGTFSSAKFFKHARIRVSPEGEILARFDDGDPALAAAEIGKGRVLIFASSADDATNDLPIRSVYLPFWYQILHYLENVQQERQWMDVGDTIFPKKLLAEEAVRERKGNLNLNQPVVVMDPERNRVAMASASDAVTLDMAGFYEIRTLGLNTSVAVNPALRESDLAHGNWEEMAAGWVSADASAPAVISSDERPTPEEQDRQARLWRYLLLAVLVLLIVEGFLANRFVLRRE
jgi:hypothetical protein